ncbi:MAG: DUF305 domain-containing protein [Nocardiopsis sp. BM-2018]|nr:MAG: DUF305 domain-containing protein [Nocardiopsis sp. BM-2018]
MSAPHPVTLGARLRERLRDDLARSVLVMLAAASLVVLAFASGLGQRAVEHGVHGDDAHGGASHAAEVRSEAAFLAAMIPHHEEAVTSAEAILALTERDEVRALALDIVEVQAEEIAQLRAWLETWYPRQGAAPYEPMMRPFTGLRPHEADEVFVADMIHHHEGAIEMAEAYLALRGPRRPEVEALADDVIRVQRAEIAALQVMLRMWGAAEPDHGGH